MMRSPDDAHCSHCGQDRSTHDDYECPATRRRHWPDDKYGSVYREQLKRSMSEPFRPLNKLAKKQEFPLMQRIVAWCGMIAGIVTLIAQIWIKWGPK